jgi:hypothetical protein
MDKNFTKKASILIWSVFLLLFLSTSFIYISTKIGKYMDNSEELANSTGSKYEFLNWTQNIENQVNGEKYEYINNSIYTWVLRNLESKTFTWVNQTVNFVILSWWGTGSVYYSWNSQTWLTNTGFTLNYVSTWTLSITNSGGFSNYTINIAPEKKEYIIYKEIWGKKFIKEKWEK